MFSCNTCNKIQTALPGILSEFVFLSSLLNAGSGHANYVPSSSLLYIASLIEWLWKWLPCYTPLFVSTLFVTWSAAHFIKRISFLHPFTLVWLCDFLRSKNVAKASGDGSMKSVGFKRLRVPPSLPWISEVVSWAIMTSLPRDEKSHGAEPDLTSQGHARLVNHRLTWQLKIDAQATLDEISPPPKKITHSAMNKWHPYCFK